MARIPVMREFKHPELGKVRLPDSALTAKELKELVNNTNFLIENKLHVPGFRLTHEGREDRPEMKGKSLGWAEKLVLDKDLAIADASFTPTGKKLIGDREVRWVSSGIRRDFRLTGEPNGPVLPGLYLDHLAVLGDENPAVKGLVDLSQVQLSEKPWKFNGREMFVIDEKEGEVAYFSEIKESLRKEIDMKDEDKDEKDSTVVAMFKELNKKVDAVTSDNAELKKKLDAVTKEKDELAKSQGEAQFAEYSTGVDAEVAKVQKDKNLGAEFADSIKVVGKKLFGNRDAEAAFKKMLTHLPAGVSKTRVLKDDEEETKDLGADEAKFSEQISKLKMSDLNAAARDVVKAKEIDKIVQFKRKSNPKYSIRDLREEIREARQ